LKSSITPLLLNKQEELRIKQSLCYKPINKISSQSHSTTTAEGVVISDYLQTKAESILNNLSENPFGHFAVTGPPGSSKMSLLHSVNHLYHEEFGL
jgi:hypothetical protein